MKDEPLDRIAQQHLDASLAGLPLAVVDVESTGLGPESRAVEIAVVHLELASGNFPRVAWCSRLDPGVPMESAASRVTGITDDDLMGEPPFESVVDDFMAAIRGRVLCAYNVPADFTWVKREIDIHNDGKLVSGPRSIPGPAEWIDGLVLASVCDKYEKSKRLASVCERRGVVVDAHGAAGDAVATALVLERLFFDCSDGRSPTAKWPTLAEYLDWQRGRALDNESDFCAYMLRTYGSDKPRPECPWHTLLDYELPAWPEQAPKVGRCLKCRAPANYTIDKSGAVGVVNPDGTVHNHGSEQ